MRHQHALSKLTLQGNRLRVQFPALCLTPPVISRLTCGSTSSRAILSCSWILRMVSILVPNMCPWKLPYSSSSFPEMPLVIASLEMKKYSSPWASSFRWGLVVSAGKPEDWAKQWPDKITAILLKMGVSTHVVQGRKTSQGIWSIKHFLCASFLHPVHLTWDILIKMTSWRKLNQSPTDIWVLIKLILSTVWCLPMSTRVFRLNAGSWTTSS